MDVTQKDMDRFLKKIEIGGDNCWNWTANKYTAGYGQFWLNGKPVAAHRLIWELYHGAIPEGLQVNHTCNNRACVNISHLELTTTQENTAYMVQQKRQAYGAKNGRAKLSPEQIKAIRLQYTQEHRPIIQLAKEFGISRRQIKRILTQEEWKNLE